MSKEINNPFYYAQIESQNINPLDLNSIEPAAGDKTDRNDNTSQEEQDIITQKLIESLSTLSTLDYGEQ